MNVDKQGRTAVYGLQIEANRKAGDGRVFDRSDIDTERTGENIFLRETENWNKYITREIKTAGLKERSNSKVLITGVYTASPDWFDGKTEEEVLSYFNDCLEYHDRTYGRAFNAVIHMDEKTPHMQVASVPIIEDEKGKHLSAKIVMGGRVDYRKRQDQFYEQVGLSHGLERGERRDPAEIKAHTTKREWQLATQEEKLQEQAERLEQGEQRLAEIQEQVEYKRDKVIGTLDEKYEALSGGKKTFFGRKKEALQDGDVVVSEYRLRVMKEEIEESKRYIRELSEQKTSAEKDRERARADRQRASEEREQAERDRARAEELLANREAIIKGEAERLASQWLDVMHKQTKEDWEEARASRKRAEQRESNMNAEIMDRAIQLVKRTKERERSDLTERMEQYLRSTRYEDGTNALEDFEEWEEQYIRDELECEWEREW
jgi:hypothetical protein